MSWILVAAAIAGGPQPLDLTAPPTEAAAALATDLPTGSLIFSQGDCLAVKVFSASRYTHVGSVVERAGGRYVYDSTGGAGVRTLPLAEFLAAQGDADLFVYRPRAALTERRRARFEQHLESQLGRPYAITHHLTGQRTDGLHCAEYATDALIAASVLKAEQPPRVSPASLREGIERDGLYELAATVHLTPEADEPPTDAGWCRRLWFDTVACTRGCCRKLSGWFLCK